MEASKNDPKQTREAADEARSPVKAQINGLETINHGGLKVKTNIRAGATINGLKTINGS